MTPQQEAMRQAYRALAMARSRGADQDWARVRLAILAFGAACEEAGKQAKREYSSQPCD